MCNVIH